MKVSPWFRTTLTSAFILLMLASAHLFMVVVNAAEAAFDPPRLSEGLTARMVTDRPVAEELAAAAKKTKAPDKRQVLEAALAEERAGRPVALRTLPVTRFLVGATLGLTALGAVLIWLTSRLRGDAAQTIVGVFGGNLMWTGGVEYGLTIAARELGVGKAVGVVDGQAVAIYGEYVLLKHSWGLLALVVGYLVFLETSRCPIFVWWRKNVPTMRGPVVSGRIDNYGPRSGFQYATTVWGFYLLLLWAYDERVMGVYSLATKALLALSIAGAIYCVRRLHQQPGWGAAVRYAIGAMIVVWTPVEIASKWGLMREPWLLLRPETLLIFFGGLAAGTWALWSAQRRRLRALALVPVEPARAPGFAGAPGSGGVLSKRAREGEASTAVVAA
ncbi:MAG: hypothetical protein MUF34_05420 [Polyangiaceae bacterium]|nr:hypothetical protein [Polyangiaceae bacterium]